MGEVEIYEIPLFTRDVHDYEVGSPMWQHVMTHNICVRLLKREPLTDEDMGFLKIQNDHIKREKKKKEIKK